MVGMQSEAQEMLSEAESLDDLITSPSSTLHAEHHRRRVSGIHMPKAPVGALNTYARSIETNNVVYSDLETLA